MICTLCEKENWHSFGNLHSKKELLCCKSCGGVYFKIKNKDTSAYLSDSDVHKIFPPYIGPGSSSEYYIDFVKLAPKISDNILGSKIHLECEFSIANAKEDSMFNVVSVCSYGNTLDDKKIDEILRTKLIAWKDEGKTNDELNFETQN